MAHFAKISNDNTVLTVLVVEDKNCLNANGVEEELIGQQYLEQHNNWPANQWIQTSINTIKNTHRLGGTPFRGNAAGIGHEWDSVNQIFWHEKPSVFNSWVKDISTASWVSPIGEAPTLTFEERLTDYYSWDEDNLTWVRNQYATPLSSETLTKLEAQY
tara:strand:+ start:1067 stop:1543 length:477 start_codon:yes stop_codon:yes gene_type:complete